MATSLKFHPLVAHDIADASAWYERHSENLGQRFRQAVDARFDDILANPQLFPGAFDDLDLRVVRLRRFPYLVLYQILEDCVYVLGVFHSARDVARWRERASE